MNSVDMNESADFWRDSIGVDTYPANTKEKKINYQWSKHKDNPLSEKEFQILKQQRAYEKGIAIKLGKVRHHPAKSHLYLLCIDIDKSIGLNAFLVRDDKSTTIQDLAKKTLVEQHEDDIGKAHIYFYSPFQFPEKGSDSTIGIEVRSNGLMFCSNSVHKNGHRYTIQGTDVPRTLDPNIAMELIRHIDAICRKYGLKYLEKGENAIITPKIREMVSKLEVDNTIIIPEGQRHITLLSLADSLLIKHHILANKSTDELKQFFENINSNLCKPYPLPQKEIDSIWKNAIGFVEDNREQLKSRNIQVKKKESLIEEATETILSLHKFTTIEESKEILYYNNGVYEKGGEILIEKELETNFGYRLKINDIKEIKDHIRRKTYVKNDEFDKDLNIINLKNGLYLIDENKIIQHDPNYYSLNQKPLAYDLYIKPKLFGKFLSEVLYPSEIRTAIEIMAYTFLRYNPFEVFCVLVGVGSNGKNVFTGILNSLHGSKNVSNVSLKSILQERFALADLENKDVNVDTELSSGIINDISTLKKLTGKQPIRIERKNKDAYDTILHAKQFFSANELPSINDVSDARFRREILIPFPNQFEEGINADPKLLEKLTSDEELSGIFNVLMKALRRILKNQRIYVNQKTIQERREKHELVSNPIKIFLDNAIAEDSIESDQVIKDDLYIAYQNFCKYHRLPIENKENFGRILKKVHCFKDGRQSKGERKTIWKYVRLVNWANTDPQ